MKAFRDVSVPTEVRLKSSADISRIVQNHERSDTRLLFHAVISLSFCFWLFVEFALKRLPIQGLLANTDVFFCFCFFTWLCDLLSSAVLCLCDKAFFR